jgi:hypothetical protein
VIAGVGSPTDYVVVVTGRVIGGIVVVVGGTVVVVVVGVGMVGRVSDEFWVDGWPLKSIVPMPTTITTPAMMVDHRQNASPPAAVRTHLPDAAEDPIGTPWRVSDATE